MASSGDVVAPVKSVDKLKYLEKYMSGKEKKKKKRAKPSVTQRLRILDDDVDLKHIPSAHSREATPEDDEPLVASVIDDRPLQARVAEQYTPAQWKKIGKDADKEEIGASAEKRRSDDSDASPPRKRLACYRRRHDSDSDLSPERPSTSAESTGKREELARSHRSRGTPPVESKSSRRQPSPQKARQRSPSELSPQRRPVSPTKSKREIEESHQKHHSSSSSKHSQSKDASSGMHKHRREQTSTYRSSSPDLSGAKDARVKVKVEPTDETTERKNSRNKSDGKHSRRHASNDSPDSPPKSRRGHTDSEHSSFKNRTRNHDKRHHSPSPKEVCVKVEPPSPSDDRDVERVPRVRHDSDSDLSPVRTSGAAGNTDSDLSPERPRRTADGVAGKGRRSSDSDLSPPRPGKAPGRRNGSDSDLTPAREPRFMSESPVPFELRGSDPVKVPCSDGSGHYLVEPDELREKFRVRSKQRPHKSRKITRKSSPSVSKRNSEKHGKDERESTKAKGKEPEKVQEVVKLRDTTKADKAKEKAAKEAEMATIYSKWGKGLMQQEQQDQKLAEHLHEMSKPFSRYEDDEDLEKHLKDQEREGDPMLNYIRKKKKQKGNDAAGRPAYSGPEPPPNRFGIRPGYRWDGVDRSNGFEKKLIDTKNNKKATEEIAYKWSVEDL